MTRMMRLGIVLVVLRQAELSNLMIFPQISIHSSPFGISTYVMSCNVMLYSIIQYDIVKYKTIHYNTLQYDIDNI